MARLFRVKVRKIGTSLGVLMPKSLIQEEGIKEGEEVEIAVLKKKKKELIEKAFGMAKGVGPFVRDVEEDRV